MGNRSVRPHLHCALTARQHSTSHTADSFPRKEYKTNVHDCKQSQQRRNFPERLVGLAWAALLPLLFLFTPCAWAGQYTSPGPTGGTYSDSTPESWPYAQDFNGPGYGAETPGYVFGGTTTCTGTITTVYTWQPDYQGEPPPQQVVVMQYCDALWIASGMDPVTGSCDDGLGDAEQVENGGNPSHGYAGTGESTGTHYAIQDGGNTVTITCSPSATSSSSMSDYACVRYRVSVLPLQIDLSGGVESSGRKYLIGQKCTGTLESGGLTPSNYDWSASGGDPFKDWAAAQESANLVPLGSQTGNSLSCYFKKPDTGIITCTVDLAVPAGAQPAGGFPGTTVTSPQCSIFGPGASFSAYIGSVIFNDPVVRLKGLGNPNYDEIGIEWTCWALTPILYVQGDDVGGWNFVQLVTPGRHRVNQGVQQGLTLNGYLCLDNRYDYAPDPIGSFPADPPGNYPADQSVHTDSDAPGEILFDEISSQDDLDSFHTWMMYIPPGSDSCYVPIREIDWYWHAALTQTGGVWTMTSSPNDCGWEFDGGLYPDFPQWQYRIDNNTTAYTPPVP